MKRLAWITDAHLDFLDASGIQAFLSSLQRTEADAFLLGGDLGQATDLVEYLRLLQAVVARPIYFVLGNHDFYRGSITGVRTKLQALCSAFPSLHWLPKAGVVPLTETTCLIGHDGWGDARYGDYWSLRVQLNDWWLIADFAGLNDAQRLAKLQELGDQAAAHFRTVFPLALQNFRQVIVLTHVPPFREACWHEGRISDADWLPHFTCRAAGDVLRDLMLAHPDCEATVLCGHTHGEGVAQVLPNLRAWTGGAVYGKPRIQRVFEVA
jgi:3',5'-cyclic-AMP phosphodiesterase